MLKIFLTFFSRKVTCASGVSILKIIINKPPCCGNCTVKNVHFEDKDLDLARARNKDVAYAENK